MTTHFIVSVGTSIFKKYKEKAKTDLPIHRGLLPDSNFVPEPSALCSNYQAKVKKILENPLCQGAEEKSIMKVMAKRIPELSDCHFHLICTRTSDCIFCASYLGHEKFKGKTEFYLPKGLGEAEDGGFVTEGIPSLLSEVAGILNRIGTNDEAVIIPTGGYKAIIPYLTIAGILYKIPIYYIYEDSETLLELPAPPLGVNTAEFRSALVLLENIVGLNEESAKPYLDELSEMYRSLVYLENGVYQYNAFGIRLKKLFHDQPVSPLVARVTGNKLIRRLGKYEEKFRQMTKLGETVWIGDKAPEMADHARHHHTNLLSYAELLLAPILHDNETFLKPDELFLLLGVIYLHDCGHSRSMIPITPDKKTEVPLLPTEIRNLHNLLGYYRMKDPAFHNCIKRQGLTLDDETLTNIAALSLYHRKKMSLLEGDYETPSGEIFHPLQKRPIRQNGELIRSDLILALFRIIDGMDKQIGRAGDAVEISMRAEAILADLGQLKARIDRLEKMVSDLSLDANKIADDMFNRIKDKYFSLEKTQPKEDGASGEFRPCKGYGNSGCRFECRSPVGFSDTSEYIRMEELLKEKGRVSLLPLAWEYLDAKIRFMFQAIQPTYYYSDLLLLAPKVTHSTSHNGKKRHIVINYLKNSDTDAQNKIQQIWNEIRTWGKSIGYDMKTEWSSPVKFVEGIREEYCRKENGSWVSEVAQILYSHGITIEFQFEGRPVRCWQNGK